MSDDILAAAVEWINDASPDDKPVTVSDVLGWRATDETVTVVVDRGIRGGPKYIINRADLPKPKPPATKAKKPAKKAAKK